MTVGGYVSFGIYLAMLTWPLIALGWTTNLFQRGAASMSRVLDLLDALPAGVTDEGTSHGRHRWRRARTGIPQRVVSLSRCTRDDRRRRGWSCEVRPNRCVREPRWVLRDVSFTVPAGGTLAIVGATGSGKSALVDLIPRLFDPQRGSILLDGIPLPDYLAARCASRLVMSRRSRCCSAKPSGPTFHMVCRVSAHHSPTPPSADWTDD